MYRDLLNIIILITTISFLNGCSIITQNTNITDWIDKTEGWFFGEKEQSEKTELGELGKFAENFPDVRTVPMNSPPVSELEIDFIEEKSEELPRKIVKNNRYEIFNNTMESYTRISNKVKNMFRDSDPPSDINGVTLNFKKTKVEDISNKQKIAIIQFASNSITPDDNAIEIIEQIVNNFSLERLEIVGHASTRGGKNSEGRNYNLQISSSRANSIKNMLVNYGFLKEKISVQAKGDKEPLFLENDSYSEASNRRVEIYLIQ